jgi:hypothetical protein
MDFIQAEPSGTIEAILRVCAWALSDISATSSNKPNFIN